MKNNNEFIYICPHCNNKMVCDKSLINQNCVCPHCGNDIIPNKLHKALDKLTYYIKTLSIYILIIIILIEFIFLGIFLIKYNSIKNNYINLNKNNKHLLQEYKIVQQQYNSSKNQVELLQIQHKIALDNIQFFKSRAEINDKYRILYEQQLQQEKDKKQNAQILQNEAEKTLIRRDMRLQEQERGRHIRHLQRYYH